MGRDVIPLLGGIHWTVSPCEIPAAAGMTALADGVFFAGGVKLPGGGIFSKKPLMMRPAAEFDSSTDGFSANGI